MNQLPPLPCPFCGSEPRQRRQMDESLYSHATVEFLQIHCDECDASSVCSEDHDAVLTAWNTRAALAQQPAQPVAWRDSTPTLNVGDSSFESWFSEYRPGNRGDKQRARDAYAGGMGDPLVTAAPTAQQAAPARTWTEADVKKAADLAEVLLPKLKAARLADDDGAQQAAPAQRQPLTLISAAMIECWRANYGLDQRTPADAARYWSDTCAGMAPAGAVAALGLALEELAAHGIGDAA
jgi:Lar family restriction alleviation protein